MLMVTMLMEMIMIIMIMIADDYWDNDTYHDHDCHHRYIELTEDDKEKLKGSYKV